MEKSCQPPQPSLFALTVSALEGEDLPEWRLVFLCALINSV